MSIFEDGCSYLERMTKNVVKLGYRKTARNINAIRACVAFYNRHVVDEVDEWYDLLYVFEESSVLIHLESLPAICLPVDTFSSRTMMSSRSPSASGETRNAAAIPPSDSAKDALTLLCGSRKSGLIAAHVLVRI